MLKRERDRRHDAKRGSARQRGYSARWDRLAKLFRDRHPMCAMCEARGHITPSACVDHIRPHKGDPVLFWDQKNWQALCTPCHSSVKQSDERDGGRRVGVDGWPVDPKHRVHVG